MKKLHKAAISMLLALILLTCFTVTNAAGLSEQLFITIKINEQPIFMDSAPYIKQNRTFVPIRFIAEAFNMEVEWIQEEKKAVITGEDVIMEMQIGNNRLLVNNREITMDVNVEAQNSRTMVPVRYIAEALDCLVAWDPLTYSVKITKEGVNIPESVCLSRPYTDDDLIWLARIVHVESLGLSIEAKVAVANVVLNRVKSHDFPDTVYDVIFDAKYSKQFPPAHRPGFTELIPDQSCVIAAKMALEGINNIDKCLYFNHKPFNNKSGNLYKVIEGEYFYF